MTRKCAICKASNYKNGSSFFSAPKDPEIRKLWQDAIGIENFVVQNDTYVCSNHFYQTDIVTHWFSGVPPNVITIKYKKFRLRPGAVPKIHIDPDELDPQFVECDTGFEVNRSLSPISNPLTLSGRTGETFSIPRTDVNNEERLETLDLADQDSHCSFDNVSDFSQQEDSQDTQGRENPGMESILEGYEFLKNHNSQEPKGNVFPEDQKLLEGDISFNTLLHSNLHTNIHFENEKIEKEEQDWEVESIFKRDDKLHTLDQISPSEEQNTSFNSSNADSKTMLFEDLLETYTEVNLPRGWITYVIPRGCGSTIVYSLNKINKMGIPVVQKQVFVQNNMVIRCSVKDIVVDPSMHNLIKDNRNSEVQTLMDVEELINEFDKRRICEGNEVMNNVNEGAFREGPIWRHNSCSLLINNGAFKCSKCASLGKRKYTFEHDSYSVRKSQQVELQERMTNLNESIQKQVESIKSEVRLPPLLSNTVDLVSEAVDLLNLPKIQKVMIKECLKFKNSGEEDSVEFSRTWIFLCLLLYIESPEMYKYMLLNKYMNLAPLLTVRAYLKRVKADREFYNIFQQSVETFQSFDEELEAEK